MNIGTLQISLSYDQLLNLIKQLPINIDYHGKNVPYRYISDILLNKVLIISDLILGK